MTTMGIEDTYKQLADVVLLLHAAAQAIWADAECAGPRSLLHSLGLGVDLAHDAAVVLLPEDYVLPVDLEQQLPETLEVGPLAMLEAAEVRTRPLPVHDPALTGGVSTLVVQLCDLIREARGVGY